MDFSSLETRELYKRLVEEKRKFLGCSLEQAQILCAALLLEPTIETITMPEPEIQMVDDIANPVERDLAKHFHKELRDLLLHQHSIMTEILPSIMVINIILSSLIHTGLDLETYVKAPGIFQRLLTMATAIHRSREK